MAFLQAQDAISGREGSAFATINGEVKEMFYIKKLKAEVEKKKVEFRVVGSRGTQHKVKEMVYTGTLTIYDVTPTFVDLMYQYQQTGEDTYFTIQVVNDDAGSTIGTKRTALYGVNLDKMTVAQLDSEADFLETDIPFTYNSFEPISEFTDPSSLGGS